MPFQQKLGISLLIIRIATGLFLLVWSIEKIIQPWVVQNVFSKFYFLEISTSMCIGLGIVQTIIVLLFMAGLFKVWTYGLVLGMHGFSTLSTYKQLLNPYETPNHLFWAAVPTVAALIALFILRKEDNMFVITKKEPSLEME